MKNLLLILTVFSCFSAIAQTPKYELKLSCYVEKYGIEVDRDFKIVELEENGRQDQIVPLNLNITEGGETTTLDAEFRLRYMKDQDLTSALVRYTGAIPDEEISTFSQSEIINYFHHDLVAGSNYTTITRVASALAFKRNHYIYRCKIEAKFK